MEGKVTTAHWMTTKAFHGQQITPVVAWNFRPYHRIGNYREESDASEKVLQGTPDMSSLYEVTNLEAV